TPFEASDPWPPPNATVVPTRCSAGSASSLTQGPPSSRSAGGTPVPLRLSPRPSMVASARAPLPGRRFVISLSIQRRTQLRRPAAIPLAAVCAALFVILALVAPVLAVEGPTRLYDVTVSPSSGTPTTTIAFQIGYR